MSFDDILRNARTSPAVVYDKFIRKYINPGYLHLFFEGPDDPSFYTGFIEHFVSPEIIEEPYICNGKERVYEVFDKITKRLDTESAIVTSSIRVLFFVDKDHSDINGEVYPESEFIFVTDYYSIESYLVTTHVFRRIWREYFHFYGGDQAKLPEYEHFEAFFLQQLHMFYSLILPVMIWIIIVRRLGERPQLEQLDLGNLFKFNDDLHIMAKVNRKFTSLLNALERMCNCATPNGAEIQMTELEVELTKLSEPKLYVRGKFELWFLSKFVKKLAEKFQNSDVNFKFRNENHIEPEQIIQSLGPRSNFPERLRVFLGNHLNNFPPLINNQPENDGRLL